MENPVQSFPTAATDTSPVNNFVQSYHHQESHTSTDTEHNPKQKCFHYFKDSIQVTDSLCSLPAKPLAREVSQQALMAQKQSWKQGGAWHDSPWNVPTRLPKAQTVAPLWP